MHVIQRLGLLVVGLEADEIVEPRLEGLAVGRVPVLIRLVARLVEDDLAVPVGRLARQLVDAFEQQHVLAGLRELSCHRAAARPEPMMTTSWWWSDTGLGATCGSLMMDQVPYLPSQRQTRLG
ncbi:MAG: hypothetical protein ABI277_08525 [Burkholderiaceae bacterium]